MDVRHYAFLARQPSAAVKTREHFWGMPKRGVAFLLASVMCNRLPTLQTLKQEREMELKFYCIYGGHHAIAGEVFYRDAMVSSGENAQRYELYICSVLNAIAQIQEDCDQLLDYIASVENGSEKSVETGGNDVVLTMDASGVQVDIRINDDWNGQREGKFTLQEWRLVLEQWRYFLGLPESLDSVVTVRLP